MRGYTRLPSDDELAALYAVHGTSRAVAAAIGCSPSAVNLRITRMVADGRPVHGYRTRRSRASRERDAFEERIRGLESAIAALVQRVDALERRPSVAFLPDHRRVADGGKTVRQQRREFRDRLAG